MGNRALEMKKPRDHPVAEVAAARHWYTQQCTHNLKYKI